MHDMTLNKKTGTKQTPIASVLNTSNLFLAVFVVRIPLLLWEYRYCC